MDKDENGKAPGPVDANSHIDMNAKDGRSSVDPRAASLDEERKRAAASALPLPEAPPVGPAESIMVTELQEIKARLDVIGTAAFVGVWFLGVAVCYGIYIYVKHGEVPK